MEGLGSVLSGADGACHAIATYSSNVSLIAISRVGIYN